MSKNHVRIFEDFCRLLLVIKHAFPHLPNGPCHLLYNKKSSVNLFSWTEWLKLASNKLVK